MQKFLRGQRVYVTMHLPQSMSHFPGAGQEAIIVGSYSDLCEGIGDDSVNGKYCLFFPRIDNRVSWYEEGHLTLVNGDRDAGERMLQEYKTRRLAEYLADSAQRSKDAEGQRPEREEG